MSWQVFFSACALFLVFEGILPFLSPNFWRRSMLQLLTHSDKVLRITGLVSMVVGVTLLSLVRLLTT